MLAVLLVSSSKLAAKVSRAKQRADRIREEVSIVQVLADYGYMVDPAGEDREQQFSCDLHGDGRDTKPSARVYPVSASYYCFACGRSRDAIEIVREKEGLEFWESVRLLEKRYDLPSMPWAEGDRDVGSRTVRGVDSALNRSVSPEDALARVARFVDNLCRERVIPAEKCASLWEAHDKVQHYYENDGSPDKCRELATEVLSAAKEAAGVPT